VAALKGGAIGGGAEFVVDEELGVHGGFLSGAVREEMTRRDDAYRG
jgi:hypothetical protein